MTAVHHVLTVNFDLAEGDDIGPIIDAIVQLLDPLVDNVQVAPVSVVEHDDGPSAPEHTHLHTTPLPEDPAHSAESALPTNKEF